MYTNQLPARTALPADILIPDELSNPDVFYLPQIFDHAHSVFCAISLIEVLQSRTGEGSTGGITVFPLALVTKTQRALLAAFCIRG